MWVRPDSHYTSRFRSVAERDLSVEFSHVYSNDDFHTDWNVSVTYQFRSVAVPSLLRSDPSPFRHVSGPFRRRCLAKMFEVTELVRTCLYLLDSNNVNILTSPLHFECLLATCAACFCLQKWVKSGKVWYVNVRNYMTYQIGSIVTVFGKKNRGDK